MNIFEYTNYRHYLQQYLVVDEAKQAGARKRLLTATGISSSLLTQIFSEQKQLSQEHGYEVALHIGLSDKETDYFLLLLDFGRAGSHKLKERIQFKMKQMQIESEKISAKIKTSVILTDQQKAIYYSNWTYTAIRNLVPTAEGKSIKSVSEKLGLPLIKVEHVVQYLIDIGLLKNSENGLSYQPGYSHLDSSSEMAFRHHQNWRQRAIHRMDHYSEDHLHYTSPMSLSRESAKKIRQKLANDIKEINQLKSDPPEVAFCCNIDFFEY